MKRNKFAVVAIIATMIVGALCLSWRTHVPQVASIATSITGNSSLVGSPDAYLTICLPKDWKSDPRSQQLLADTAKPNFAKLRQAGATKIYVEGDADFEHRFHSAVGQLPAVCAQDGDGKTYKWSGDNCRLAESQMDGCIRKILCHPHPDKPEPKEDPKPEPSDRPTLPDVNTTPTAITSDIDPTKMILVCAVCGFGAWAVVFRRG